MKIEKVKEILEKEIKELELSKKNNLILTQLRQELKWYNELENYYNYKDLIFID